MTAWREVALEEVAASGRYSVVGGPFGSALGRKDYTGDGVPVIRGAQLGGPGCFSHGDLVYVSEEKADSHLGNLAYPGDVLVTQRGTVGQVGLIPDDAPFDRYLLSQSQMKLTVNPARANARFVYYWLRSPEAQHAMVGSTISAGVPHINLATFKGIKLPLPSLKEQRAIAGVLHSIDDLIENNRRRVEVLEEMARAIYREWFVRFRYPGHEDVPLVDSPLGPIPAGWRVGCVDDLVTLNKATVDPSTIEPSTPAVGLEHIPRQQITLDSWGKAGDLGSRKATFVAGDILFGKIRPYFHKVSVAPVDGICSTDAIVLRPHPDHWGLAVLSIASDEFVSHAVQTSNGTKMPRADWKVIREFPVAIPSTPIARRFSETTDGFLSHAQALIFQAHHLALIRDLLLPKLVTGQIDVSHLDLDALTEAATG